MSYRCGKDTTEQYHSLDIRKLHFNRILRSGRQLTARWSWLGKVTGALVAQREGDCVILHYGYCERASEQWAFGEYRIFLTWTRCNYGGRRPWFVCPGCHSRVAVLYGGRSLFACRRCYGLAYESQRENDCYRALRRAQTIRMRLGGTGSMAEEFPAKPKGMHWSTYLRLVARFTAAERQSSIGMLSRLGVL